MKFDILTMYPKNRWLGQYIQDESLPELSTKDLKEFLLGAFWPGLPWLYATNKDVLLEVNGMICAINGL